MRTNPNRMNAVRSSTETDFNLIYFALIDTVYLNDKLSANTLNALQ